MSKALGQEDPNLWNVERSREDFDSAVCSLNAEVIQLQKALGSDPGHKLTVAIKSLRHPATGLPRIGGAVKGRIVSRRVRKLNQPNEGFLTWDEGMDSRQKVAVYTCITGGYDGLKEPLFKAPNIDYFVVTDAPVPTDSTWQKIELPNIEGISASDNVKRARYVKTHPHLFFAEYEYSIWVDANFLVVGDLSKFICCLSGNVPFASNWHPQRNCIYLEAEACKLYGKDSGGVIDAQVQAYRKEGMPENFGLFETNMIVRRHNDERCIALMEAWWEEISKWSRRDQLSLPYVIWKQGYTMRDFGFICTEIRENPSVRVVAHADLKILRGGALQSDVIYFAPACAPSELRRAA